MRILCVHQGHELYGSDRAFVEAVAAMRTAWPQAAIDVVLPRPGPIVAALAPSAATIIIEPLWAVRRRFLLRLATIGLLRLPVAVWRAWRHCRAADLVYVSTVVLIDYLIAARLVRMRALVHVHEIPEGFARRAFRALLRFAGGAVIFNSRASRAAFALPSSQSQHVVYNSIAAPAAARPSGYDGTRPLRLLLIGRINRIKGQDILIDAIAMLPAELRARLELRIVGGSFANERAREEGLRARAARAGLTPIIRFEPFMSDPAPLYDWADVVVVPSRRPESLGRVAIEAMAHGRPPLASAIGGLEEVVEHGVSGWLVPPNDAPALAQAIGDILLAPEVWSGFPAAARARFEAVFDPRAIACELTAILAGRLAAGSSARRTTGLAPV